jgi:YbbR domain-containing protein
MWQWMWENVRTLLLALLLAVVVWAVAVNEENPIQERTFDTSLEVTLLNQRDDLVIVSTTNLRTTATIRAPQQTWEVLTADQIHVTADLAGLGPGTYTLPMAWALDTPAARVTRLAPDTLHLTLERRTQREFRLQVEPTGELALGYEAGSPHSSVVTATVTGPVSAVDRVSTVLASFSLANLRNDFEGDVALTPVDAAGKTVSEVSVEPVLTRIRVPVTQKPGFRTIAVNPDITGTIASGYRITNITVSPLLVTVTSADPATVNALPGFVRTQSLDIGGASDDIEVRVPLVLPEGVALVGDQSVLLQISIAALDSSLTVPRQVEIQGLGVGLSALPSPDTVDVLLFGPLPVLDQLRPEDVRVILDVTGLLPGTHQVTPKVILLSDKLRAENWLPAQIEVVIVVGPPPTPTPTLTPTSTITPTPRPTRPPTFTPTATPTGSVAPAP